MLVLPYKGIQGEQTLKHIKRKISNILPEDEKLLVV